MLTSREIEIITVEVALGKEPTIKGKEADEFRKKVAKEIDEIRASGNMVSLPSDLN